MTSDQNSVTQVLETTHGRIIYYTETISNISRGPPENTAGCFSYNYPQTHSRIESFLKASPFVNGSWCDHVAGERLGTGMH